MADVKISAATLQAAAALHADDRFPIARSASTVAFAVELSELFKLFVDWLNYLGVNPLDNGAGNGLAIKLQTGAGGAGNSGDLTLKTGTATGTRGSIILDAPLVTTPTKTGATPSEALSLASGTAVNGQTGGVFLFSGDTSGTGQTGNTWVYTGNTSAGTASTGDVNILSGDSFGGTSGNIHLTAGAAATTRGHVVVDAPTTLIKSTLISFDNGSTAPGSDVSLLGVDVTTGTSAELDLITGNATGAGVKTGPLFLGSGNSAADVSGLASLGSGSAGTTSGECDLFSGDGASSGVVAIASGNASAGNSGNITLKTGTATGTRGQVSVDASAVQFIGMWSANGAVATALTSVGPAGAHTTVQEWFVVKNASGVVRYIPAF